MIGSQPMRAAQALEECADAARPFIGNGREVVLVEAEFLVLGADAELRCRLCSPPRTRRRVRPGFRSASDRTGHGPWEVLGKSSRLPTGRKLHRAHGMDVAISRPPCTRASCGKSMPVAVRRVRKPSGAGAAPVAQHGLDQGQRGDGGRVGAQDARAERQPHDTRQRAAAARAPSAKTRPPAR